MRIKHFISKLLLLDSGQDCSHTNAIKSAPIDTFENTQAKLVETKLDRFHGSLNDQDVKRVLELVEAGKVKTVVLDCGGVLIKTDIRKMLKEMTVAEKFWMTAWTVLKRKKPDIQWMSDKLSSLVQDDRFNDKLQIYSEGVKLPPIICLWQAGIVDGLTADKMVSKAIADAVADKRLSKLDARALSPMCRMAFDDDAFVRSRGVIPAGLKLLRALRGFSDVQVALLTNFDAEVLQRVRKDLPELFELIVPDNILISSDVNMVKPDAEIFALLQDRLGFDPKTALMVDDEPCNALGARQVYGYAMVTGGTLYEPL